MIVETYNNRCYENHPCNRYWVHDRLMVGGSIMDATDGAHLQIDFGLTHSLNVATEQSDDNKGFGENFVDIPTPDNGVWKPFEYWAACLYYANRVLSRPDTKLYVHCQMGGSRSPAVAYAILRGIFKMDGQQALAAIRDGGKPDYGVHAGHNNYLDSAEEALKHFAGVPPR